MRHPEPLLGLTGFATSLHAATPRSARAKSDLPSAHSNILGDDFMKTGFALDIGSPLETIPANGISM